MIMGLLDRIFGRRRDLESEPLPPGISMKDARAVDRYERMLRTAPPHTIERAHVEAFEKLTPEQLDLLFERFTEHATQIEDRPTDAGPASLAKSAVAVETRKPGALPALLRSTHERPRADAAVAASLLESVAWYAVASSVWSPFFFPWPIADDTGLGAPSETDSSLDGPFDW
jgi:hypothetical protein